MLSSRRGATHQYRNSEHGAAFTPEPERGAGLSELTGLWRHVSGLFCVHLRIHQTQIEKEKRQ